MSRHYIIVVHGMGEQNQNATAYEVVHLFAEIRQDKKHPTGNATYANFLPAHLSTQSVRSQGKGHHWSEFNGIEVNPSVPTGDFDGLPVSNPNWAGKNFIFVDLHWAPILQDQTDKGFASTTEAWTAALLNRLDPQTGIIPKEWLESWTLPVLHLIRKTVIPIKKILDFKYPELSKVVFEDVLGDIHLYGDYGRTRGRAVRHFHGVLDEIHLRDFIDWCKNGPNRNENTYEAPSYTVIAHSLGSIMSFDALVYAFTDFRVRGARANNGGYSPSFPFYGYTEEQPQEVQTWLNLLSELDTAWDKLAVTFQEGKAREKYNGYGNFRDYLETKSHSRSVPPLFWRDQVRHFFTLGSPIDKFHVLWYQNYLHMGLRKTSQWSSEPTTLFPICRWIKNWIKRLFHKSSSTTRRLATCTPLFPIVPWMQNWIKPSPKQKIIHINLCDEQDPVGHHLDVAESSINYNQIFDTSQPTLFRDILFRRYSIPGLAHIGYWKDKKLFSGVLEIIDSCVSAINFPQEFREPSPWPYRKAILWAYFILPTVLVFITDLIILYPYLGRRDETFGYSHGVALFVAGVLWLQPKVLDILVGSSRSQPSTNTSKGTTSTLTNSFETSFLAKFFRRGLFANLVYGAVEWRRILIQKYEDECTNWDTALHQDERLDLPTRGRFYFYFIPTYGLTICLLAISLAFACPSQFQDLKAIITTTTTKAISIFAVFPSPVQAKESPQSPTLPEAKEESKGNQTESFQQTLGELGVLFLLPCFMVMTYVWRVYSKAKRKAQKDRQERGKRLALLVERAMAPDFKSSMPDLSLRDDEPIISAENELFYRE